MTLPAKVSLRAYSTTTESKVFRKSLCRINPTFDTVYAFNVTAIVNIHKEQLESIRQVFFYIFLYFLYQRESTNKYLYTYNTSMF